MQDSKADTPMARVSVLSNHVSELLVSHVGVSGTFLTDDPCCDVQGAVTALVTLWVWLSSSRIVTVVSEVLISSKAESLDVSVSAPKPRGKTLASLPPTKAGIVGP